MKKVSDIDFFMKPTKYASGEVDKSGIKTRKKMEKMLGLKPDQIYLIGDTEDGFDGEYMDVLSEEIFDGGDQIKYDSIKFDEGLTEFETVSTVYGVILKVFTLSQHGEFAGYWGEKDTLVEVENAINEDIWTINEEPTESPDNITVTLPKELVEFLMKQWGESSEGVGNQIADDFDEIVREFYGLDV